MVLIFRPWVSRLTAIVLSLLTFGLWRIDVPRVPHVRRMRLRRFWLMFRAHRRGRRDGKLGIPNPLDAHWPPEIWRLKQQGDGVNRDFASQWASTEARLAGEQKATGRGIEATKSEIKQRKLEHLTLTQRHRARQVELDKVERRDETRTADDRWRISSWFYIVALVIVFAGEFPLNAVAFNLFGDNRWATYAMTSGLAAVLVFCAHCFGILLRLRKRTDRDLTVMSLVALMPLAVIISIAYVRETYLQALGDAGVGLAILGRFSGVLIFVTMNLVIYVGAFALSYLHHDPDGEMVDRVRHDVRRAARAMRRKQKEIDRYENVLRWLETKISLWKSGRERAHRQAAYQALRHKDIFETAMEAYWSSNRASKNRAWKRACRRARWRGELAPEIPAWPPACFDDTKQTRPEVKVPTVLEDGLRVAATNGMHDALMPALEKAVRQKTRRKPVGSTEES
jgi:hypothetical protein